MSRARSLPALVAACFAVPALAHAQGPAEAVSVTNPTNPTNPTSTPVPEATSTTTTSTTTTSPTTPATLTTATGPEPAPAPGPAADPAPTNEVAAAPSSGPPVGPPAPVAVSNVPPPEISPHRPRLQLSAGLVFGPHALGEADCQSVDEVSECQHRGNFLGAGATIELRAQLFKFLYAHARGVIVGNVRQRPYAVHSGLGGGGIGIGVYSNLAFIRGEYMLIPAFGPETYVPPFYDKPVGRDRYGLHAGMISGGLHKYVSPRTALELWAGMVIGPTSQRTSISEQVAEKRVLLTFMVSVGVVFDLVLAKGYVPPPKQPRKRRQW